MLTKHGIVRAGIFGSYARGEQKKNSDVDILIEPPIDRKFSLLDLSGLKIELKEVLKRNVDLISYKYIHPRLREQILNSEVSILWIETYLYLLMLSPLSK